MDLSVVIPVKNEEQNVLLLHKRLVEILPAVTKRFEIIFIDDGSTDRTYMALRSLRNATIIRFRKNYGQSAALAAGFEHAKGDLIISMDGDMQNDPGDIPRMVAFLREKNLDVVCGWRHERRDTVPKRVLSRFAYLLRNFLVKDLVHDSGCTLRVYKRECVGELNLMGEMHRYIPALLGWKGYRIGELKVHHHARRHGVTKYSYDRLLRGFLDLFNVWFWRKYSSRPLHIFGGSGLMLGIIGIVFGIYSIYLKLFRNVDLSNTFLPVLSVFFVMIGVQLFVSGIIADIAIKNYYRNGHKVYSIKDIVKK